MDQHDLDTIEQGTTYPQAAEKRRKSVKEISAIFSGNSRVESKDHHERRMRILQKVYSLTKYSADKRNNIKLTSPMRKQMMNELVSEEEIVTEDIAKGLLNELGVTAEQVGAEQWKEWEEAILVVSSPIRSQKREEISIPPDLDPVYLDLSTGDTHSPLNRNSLPHSKPLEVHLTSSNDSPRKHKRCIHFQSCCGTS
jgi:hypothetical protein